jgi:hypothetical protein
MNCTEGCAKTHGQLLKGKPFGRGMLLLLQERVSLRDGSEWMLLGPVSMNTEGLVGLDQQTDWCSEGSCHRGFLATGYVTHHRGSKLPSPPPVTCMDTPDPSMLYTDPTTEAIGPTQIDILSCSLPHSLYLVLGAHAVVRAVVLPI